ncbi:hypothetical protein [Phenylobacterium sp.]|uniref:hypothetical protein n=1 Tax=Phenylobacterium sp. TaxID=1871053 RepID=UPI0025EE6166|nr:hypothetical protein [Phenylobacterium sp.]MCA6343506.1 response regulator transcription factor [Phenylobacterium sp.]
MLGGPPYTPEDDRRIRAAVEAGARTEADFRSVALELGRPSAEALRTRAVRLGLITPVTTFTDDEDAFLLSARERGMTVREIAFALDRSLKSVELRLSQLAPPRDPPQVYARAVEQDRSVQAAACAKHARACLKAGGFWALSERRVGAGKWAVCLPLIPPPARLEGAA